MRRFRGQATVLHAARVLFALLALISLVALTVALYAGHPKSFTPHTSHAARQIKEVGGCNSSDLETLYLAAKVRVQEVSDELINAQLEIRRLEQVQSAAVAEVTLEPELVKAGESEAETSKLRDELSTLQQKLDDITAVGSTPLNPLSLQKSDLVYPSKQLETGTPFVLTLKGRTIRGSEISTGGAELYARLTGPALVAAEVEDLHDGTYRFTFVPPLEGEYSLDVVLFYEHYDRSVRKWEALDFPGEFVRGCMFQCHDVDDASDGVGGDKAALYENCMNMCREYSSGPALRDERRREEGFTVSGAFDYVKPDAPFCGVDVPVDDNGWWVNRTLVCPVGDVQCFQDLVYCSPEQYADPRAEVCNITLVWRPRTCRHVYWQATSPPPKPSVQAALERVRASKDHLLFCGDSTSFEIFKVVEGRHGNLKSSNIYGDDNRPKCFNEKPDLFIAGGCGHNSAQVSIIRMKDLTVKCRDEAPLLKAVGDQVPLIYRAAPAAFPYSGDQIVPQIAPNYPIGVRFHGQRNWLTNAQLKKYNQMVREELAAAGVKFVDWDEFKMTWPLWGFQVDALHWGHDVGIVQTIGNALMSLYVSVKDPPSKL